MTGPATILVVEDEPGIRTLMLRTLEGAGHRVIGVGTAEQALTVLASDSPRVDLLIADVVLPGMGGPELAARVRELVPGVAVLFTSGYVADPIEITGRSRGPASFLQKPYTTTELLARAQLLLGRRSA